MNEQVPVMMPDLVAEVTEKGAVRLAHLEPAPFALDVIGFRKRDRNNPVFMAGHDLCGRRIGEKIEDQAMLWIFAARAQWQMPSQQRVEQPMLGGLELVPPFEISRY